MGFSHAFQVYIAQYWQITVTVLMLSSLLADVLSRKHFPRLAVLVNMLNIGGWVILLGTEAPFSRSITFNCIALYIATILFGLFLFHEKISRSQLVGIILGGIAIVLLV